MTTTPVISLAARLVNDPTTESGDQSNVKVTELADGRILVTWEDDGDNYDPSNGRDIIGQLFEIDGTAIGQPFQVNTVWNGGTASQNADDQESSHDIAATSDGGWIVVYTDFNSQSSLDGAGSAIRLERFNADGQRVEFDTIASVAFGFGRVEHPEIEYDDGDYVVVFRRSQPDSGNNGFRGVYFEDGVRQGEYPFGSEGSSFSFVSDVAILSNGNIVMINGLYGYANIRTHVKISRPDGTEVDSFLAERNGPNASAEWTGAKVEALEGGGFVLVHVESGFPDTAVRAVVYDNSGNEVASPFNVTASSAGSASPLADTKVDVAALDDGGFVIGWIHDDEIRVQRFDETGAEVGGRLILPSATVGTFRSSFELTKTQDGRVMVVWNEGGGSGGDPIKFVVIDPRDDGVTVLGTNGDDGLTTPGGGGTVDARDGADTVLGRGGDDIFIDTDRLNGDSYNGRGGIDLVDYRAMGLAGTTTFDLIGGTVSNTFAADVDIILNIENVVGSQRDDLILTVSDTTYIDAQSGNDRVVVSSFAMNNASFDGGFGTDWFDTSSAFITNEFDIAYNLRLGFLGVNNGSWAYEGLTEFENIDGANNIGASIEFFFGNSADNIFRGNGGKDFFSTGGGIDQMFGGSGDDEFEIRASDLAAGAVIDGGADSDTVTFVEDGVFDLRPLGDNLSNIEIFALGGDFSSTPRIQMFSSQLEAAGAAQFIGRIGNEQLQVTADTATVDLSDLTFLNWGYTTFQEVVVIGNAENNIITGTRLDDRLTGGDGVDFLSGGRGDDFLQGDGGVDMLDGGLGFDTARYTQALNSFELMRAGNYTYVFGAVPGEKDILIDVEALEFSDQVLMRSQVEVVDPYSYLATHADLLQAFGDRSNVAMTHYFNFGRDAGRIFDGFDEWSYLASHAEWFKRNGEISPDDAAAHYVTEGVGQGFVKDSFDEWSYLASNVDVLTAVEPDWGLAARHYYEYGYDAGRQLDTFDEWSYLASNTDLITALGANPNAATRHYVVAGFNADRKLDSFDEWSYLASNTDLIRALGADGNAATRHYAQFGFNAGRETDTFDEFQYIASYGDLITLFGTDGDAGTRHYAQFGFLAGRAADDFDAQQYLDNYADLQAAFGNDLDAATLHYIQFGYAAGRTDDPLV